MLKDWYTLARCDMILVLTLGLAESEEEEEEESEEEKPAAAATGAGASAPPGGRRRGRPPGSGAARPLRNKRRREAYPSDGDVSEDEAYRSGGGNQLEQLPTYSDDEEVDLEGLGSEQPSDSPRPSARSRWAHW